MRKLPWAPIIAFIAFIAGAGLFITGVFVLLGLGSALLSGAGFCFLLATVILRGLLRG